MEFWCKRDGHWSIVAEVAEATSREIKSDVNSEERNKRKGEVWGKWAISAEDHRQSLKIKF